MSATIIDFPDFVTEPAHECAMEAQSLLMAADALCKRFMEQPDLVRDEQLDIVSAYTRIGLLLSAMRGRPIRAAE